LVDVENNIWVGIIIRKEPYEGDKTFYSHSLRAGQVWFCQGRIK